MSAFRIASELLAQAQASLAELEQQTEYALYVTLKEKIEILKPQIEKLANAKHKQVLSSDSTADNEHYVPMYGPKHIAKVTELESHFALLETRFVSIIPPPEPLTRKEETVKIEEQRPIAPRIIQQSFQQQNDAQAQLAEENQALAEAALQRVKKDAVDAETDKLKSIPQAEFKVYVSQLPVETARELGAILEEICKRPENATFRTLKFSNKAFAQLLQSTDLVRPCLASLGFAPKYVRQQQQDEEGEEVLAYFLPEPDLERDYEAWGVWYDKLKSAAGELTNK